MCSKHQFLSKYSIIFAKVAGCFVPRGVDRLDAEFARLEPIKLFRTTLKRFLNLYVHRRKLITVQQYSHRIYKIM